MANLISLGYGRQMPPRGKTGVPMIPHVALPSGLLSLFPDVPADRQARGLPETIGSQRCMDCSESVSMTRHVTTSQQVDAAKSTETKRGMMNANNDATWQVISVRRRVFRIETGNMAELVLSQGRSTVSADVYYEYENK